MGARVSVPGNPWRCLEVGNSNSARLEITGDSIMEPYFLRGHMTALKVLVNLPSKCKSESLTFFFKVLYNWVAQIHMRLFIQSTRPMWLPWKLVCNA